MQLSGAFPLFGRAIFLEGRVKIIMLPLDGVKYLFSQSNICYSTSRIRKSKFASLVFYIMIFIKIDAPYALCYTRQHLAYPLFAEQPIYGVAAHRRLARRLWEEFRTWQSTGLGAVKKHPTFSG